MNIQAGVSMLTALQLQLPDFLPFAGFTPAEAGHTIASDHPDVPTLRHFITADVDVAGFTISMGTTGAVDVTVSIGIIKDQHNMTPEERRAAAQKIWSSITRSSLSTVIDGLLTPELIERFDEIRQQFDELVKITQVEGF